MKTVPNPGPPHPDHPLHRASYALETIKWGSEGWRYDNIPVTGETEDEADAYIGKVLAKSEFSWLTEPRALREAAEHYAISYANQTGIPLPLARTIFLDGLLHGLAFAGGMDADPPDYYAGKDPAP